MQIHIEVAPQTLWTIPIPGTGYSFPITNTFFMMLVVMAFLLIVGTLIARSTKLVPSRVQSGFELIVEFLLGIVEGSAGKRLGRQLFPLIGGLFIFILFANYMELLPGLGSVGIRRAEEFIPFLRPPTSDLNMTLAMSIISYVVFQYAGLKAHGFVGRIKHMANPPLLFPLELISETARLVSLSFRLFGNIFAGDVVLTMMYAFANVAKFTVIGLLIPVVFLYLEVLIGFIQSLVFALLTLVYVIMAASSSHEEHAEQHAGEGEAHGYAPAAGTSD
jgi:F-type H+-transporting ATPase subunit a